MDTGGYMWNWPQVQLSLLVNWALVAKFVWNIKTQKQTHNKPKKNKHTQTDRLQFLCP